MALSRRDGERAICIKCVYFMPVKHINRIASAAVLLLATAHFLFFGAALFLQFYHRFVSNLFYLVSGKLE